MWHRELQLRPSPPAGRCRNYNAGPPPLYHDTSLLPPVTHILSLTQLRGAALSGAAALRERRRECEKRRGAPEGCGGEARLLASFVLIPEI